jgi:hypothetical protein
MNRSLVGLIAFALLSPLSAEAGIVTYVGSSGPSEIGGRIRWGGSGFEASLYDSNPFGQSPNLNPGGAPIWQVGRNYGFRFTYDSATGKITLSVDFDRSRSFETGETIERSTFAAPGQTSYAGFGFGYLEINGNETGSTGRATLSNLNLNGTNISNVLPNGGFVSARYTDSPSNLLTSVTLTGDLTFTTAGTSQERPSFNFVLADAQDISTAVVPEPSSMVLLGLGAASFGVYLARRRKKATEASV